MLLSSQQHIRDQIMSFNKKESRVEKSRGFGRIKGKKKLIMHHWSRSNIHWWCQRRKECHVLRTFVLTLPLSVLYLVTEEGFPAIHLGMIKDPQSSATCTDSQCQDIFQWENGMPFTIPHPILSSVQQDNVRFLPKLQFSCFSLHIEGCFQARNQYVGSKNLVIGSTM